MARSLATEVQYLLDRSIPTRKIAQIFQTNLINIEAIAHGEWDAIAGKPTETFRLQYSKLRIERVKEMLKTNQSPQDVARRAHVSRKVVEALLDGQWDDELCRPKPAWHTEYENRRRNDEVRRLKARLAELASEGGQLCTT